ncbi:MAG: prepilin-type N-terminal cleavage/methylation domain-containing protein [Phycisphaerae bacterium]
MMYRRQGKDRDARRFGPGGARGFSLVELLVVLSVVGLLLAILLPALSGSRRLALNLKCVAQMQKIGFEFRMFADDFAVRSRGDSAAHGANAFVADDFVDSLYRIDEFWDVALAPLVPYDPTRELMMCPAGPKKLYRRPKRTAFQLGVWPPEHVSLAMNRRLWRDGLQPGIKIITSKVLDCPDVPVILDVDGFAAVGAGRRPVYIAPPVGIEDDYEEGTYWFPAFRHNGRMNVVFVDRHVASSDHPRDEPSWRWRYHPE